MLDASGETAELVERATAHARGQRAEATSDAVYSNSFEDIKGETINNE